MNKISALMNGTSGSFLAPEVMGGQSEKAMFMTQEVGSHQTQKCWHGHPERPGPHNCEQ